MTDRPWDLLVVGGGTAGLVGATTAAALGARVLLVERARLGGDCLWTGCVPSKSLLAAAAAAAHARAAGRLGVDAGPVRVDFARVTAHVRGAVATIAPVDSAETLEAAGVVVRSGDARFTAPDTVEIDGEPVRFSRALLATGSAPAVPSVPGLREAGPLTSDTVWDLAELPARLVVLGGGSIGCELGQAFARLGSRVTLVESADRLLSREDADAAAVVAGALGEDGVRVLTGAPATRVEGGPGGGTVTVRGHDPVPYDRLLVAVGRTPRTSDLGLEAAGVAVDDRGHVRVDAHLRTTAARVWAAGDLTGHPQFTHTAGVHGSTAATNAVLGLRRRVHPEHEPRVTFTDPELAAVGVPTAGPGRLRGGVVRTVRHTSLDRAVAEGRTEGFTRLVVDGRGRVRGATVVAPRAGEALAELALAVRLGLRTRDLAGTTHAYPTYADGGWDAAIHDVRARLAAPVPARAVRALAALRRR